MVLTKKQRFGKHINGTNKKKLTLNIELIFTTTIDLKNFDARLLKIDKTSYKSIDIYYIEYITIKKIYDSESSVNPLYFRINHHASGYIEENNGKK